MNFKKVNIISKFTVEIELDDNTNIEVSKINKDEYDFFINGIKKDIDEEKEKEILDYIIDNIDQKELEWVIAVEDFNSIYNRLSFEDICIGYHHDKELMKKKINSDLELFIFHEHYDKCIVLRNLLKKINDEL